MREFPFRSLLLLLKRWWLIFAAAATTLLARVVLWCIYWIVFIPFVLVFRLRSARADSERPSNSFWCPAQTHSGCVEEARKGY